MQTKAPRSDPCEKGNPPSPGPHHKILTCALLGVTILLALAPLAEAATVGSSALTLRAPFTGGVSVPVIFSTLTGCAEQKLVPASSFNSTTGKASVTVRVHARPCNTPFGDSVSVTISSNEIIPFPAFSGVNTIHSKWTVDAALRTYINPGGCMFHNVTSSYCYSQAVSTLTGFAYVFDTTNGTTWPVANYWQGGTASSSINDACTAGICTSSVTGNTTIRVHGTVTWAFQLSGLKASHHYELWAEWDVSAYAQDFAYRATLTGGGEGASLVMAGPGLGATLDWITIR
jgi:hypothetical protein